MQGDQEVLRYLNKALKNELTAINQYFLHARMFRDWGLSRLDEYEYHESIDEMKHADRLINRILFLEGLPNLQDLGTLRIGENTREILEADLAAEHEGRELYREAIAYCESVRDFGTRDLLQEILDGEEEHIDWLETQLQLIDRVGLANYEQTQMESSGG